LGIAVGAYLRLRFTKSRKTEITGKGPLRQGAENYTHRAFLAAYAAAHVQAPEVRIETVDYYPSARGMGASASAIVAGLVAARMAGDLELSDEDLAHIAIRIEGHGDNVLAALFGGLVLNSHDGWMRFEPSPALAPVILVARDKFKTEEARRVLPVDVPRADAVANAAATAALVAILTGRGPVQGLMMAMEDRIHEPYRLPLMPESLELHDLLRAKGIPTALSGAGPSLISIVESASLGESAALAAGAVPAGWEVLTPGWDLNGAQVR
jgi:homoserine kinase